jgi:predicted amidohydrolase
MPFTGARELIAEGQPWESWSPRERVRPVFADEPGRSGPSLMIAGAGNSYGFGWWARRVPVEAGRTYRFCARLRWEGFEDPNLHLLTAVAWRRADLPRSRCPQDYLATYRHDGDRVVVEEVLRAPDGTNDAELLLALRFAPGGVVWWDSLTIEEVPAPRPQPLTVAVIRGRPPEPATAESARAYWAALLEQAAASRPDLVCLPECLNQIGTGRPAHAAMGALLAEHAVRLHAYVSGCYYEDDGGYVFNTAVLLDRGGRRVGRYRKIHPYWPEEPDGVAPGDDLPVFQTEFGAVGIMICYDSWFGETARVLALKGAELVIFPNAGYETKIMPARAIDNGLYIAIASLNSPAAILNSLGEALVERRTPGVVAATIDLAQRPSPHPNAGGALNAGPGGLRAMRNAASDRLLQELVEAHRWWSPQAPSPVPAAVT